MNLLPAYSSRDVNVAWGGLTFIGFAPDSFVTVTPANGLTESETGADGATAPSLLPNHSAVISVQLMQNSPTNQVLAGLTATQRASGRLYQAPLFISDPSGSIFILAKGCYMQDLPEMTRSSSANGSTHTWSWYVPELIWIPNPSQIPATLQAQIDDALASVTSVLDQLNPFND